MKSIELNTQKHNRQRKTTRLSGFFNTLFYRPTIKLLFVPYSMANSGHVHKAVQDLHIRVVPEDANRNKCYLIDTGIRPRRK